MNEYDNSPDPENVQPDTPQHAAYVEADTATFRGKPLNPFAEKRLIAAQRIGLALWKLTDEEKVDAVVYEDDPAASGAKKVKSFLYPGIYGDMVLITYLCLCPRSQILKAVNLPRKVQEDSMDWAEKEHVKMDDPDALRCFLLAINTLGASTSKPAPTDSSDDVPAKKE